MTTLAIMKARIADDLARADLTTQIAEAIDTAIAAHQTDRFYFNERRTVTWPTVASQEFYTSSDNANIPDLLAIDYLAIIISASDVRELDRADPADLEFLTGTSSGQPYTYAYYDQQIRLYPVPSSVWTIRAAVHKKLAAPASDAEASNAWMIDAERLIRSRAKLELALHVLKDQALASTMITAVEEARSQLFGRTARQVGTGVITPTQF